MKERFRVSRVHERRRSRLNGRIYESTGLRVGALVIWRVFRDIRVKNSGRHALWAVFTERPFQVPQFLSFFLIELIQRKNDFILLAIIERVRLMK